MASATEKETCSGVVPPRSTTSSFMRRLLPFMNRCCSLVQFLTATTPSIFLSAAIQQQHSSPGNRSVKTIEDGHHSPRGGALRDSWTKTGAGTTSSTPYTGERSRSVGKQAFAGEASLPHFLSVAPRGASSSGNDNVGKERRASWGRTVVGYMM